MLLLAVLLVPVAEVFAFVEVGLAIGWLLAVALLLGTSVLGGWLLRVQGRAASERVARALSEHRAPGAAAIDAALGFLGGGLLVVPGFLTDALGTLLVIGPTRALLRRWISRRLEARVMRLVVSLGRVAPGNRGMRPADVESTAVEDDLDQLGR
jgi:UPF0716 protein FxsA